MANTAHAQTESELAEARRWFSEAVAQAEQGEHEAAAANFRRVLLVRDSAPVRYNLALSLYELNQLREADENVQLLLEAPDTPPRVRADAADLRLHIEEIGGRLTLSVDGAEAGTYDLQLDGRSVPSRDMNRPLRVRVGTHVAIVLRGDEELASDTVEVEQGADASLTLNTGVPSPEEVAAAAAAAAAAEAPVEEEDDDRSVFATWQFWTVVAAVAIVGVTIGVVASQSGDEDRRDEIIEGNFEPGVIRF
ncbi:MAG: hypothetical protein AAF411_29005 [Myxococcota bacterium]